MDVGTRDEFWEGIVGEKTGQLNVSVFGFVCTTVAIAIIALHIGGCSRSPRIEVKGQEAILSPVLMGVCSIFMKIENSGNDKDTLVEAKVNIPNTITELHDIQDGRMVRVGHISIPAKSVVQLRPARQHIMVFKLPKDMREDAEFVLYLRFEKSGEKRVQVKLARIDKQAR